MAQGRKKLPRNPVERIGFLIKLNDKSGKYLKHLLVQFHKLPKKFIKFTVPYDNVFVVRYYYCIFVMSILAYRKFQWEYHKKAGGFQNEPIDFPLMENVKGGRISDEYCQYEFMVKYYYNMIKGNRNRYQTLPKEISNLRDCIRSVFDASIHQGKKWGAEKGKAVDMCLEKGKVDQTIFFLSQEDFPNHNFEDSELRDIDIQESTLPVTFIEPEIINDLLKKICESDFWKDWKLTAKKKHIALKSYGTERTILDHLKKESEKSLHKNLYGRDDYQELNMEAGYVQKMPIYEQNVLASKYEHQKAFGQNRNWERYNWRELLNSKDIFILSSDLGAGKTTFLRFLQKTALQDTRRIPIFAEAEDVKKWDYTDKDSFINCLSKKLQPWVRKTQAVGFLKKHLGNDLLLLVDGLDQISGVGTTYSDVLDKLLSAVDNNLIVTTRPFAVTDYEAKTEVTFIRLKPFSLRAQKKYFSEKFERACQVCKNDLNLLGEPILAYMVRTLIERKLDRNIKNRADLYKEYLDYIFTKYKHGTYIPSRQLRRETRLALGKISYDAIACAQIDPQKISLDFCRQCISDLKLKEMRIDDLPRCGFTKFIIDVNSASEEFLSFNHKSYQEYLAAEWANMDDANLSFIFENCHSMLWDETIRFLTGMRGKEIIMRLCSAAKDDFRVLVLADKYCKETYVDDRTRKTIAEKMACLINTNDHIKEVLQLMRGCVDMLLEEDPSGKLADQFLDE